MSRRYSPLARAASFIAVSLTIATLAACVTTNCPGRSPPIQVEVTVGADGLPAVSPDPIRAHEGDEVHWVFHGSTAKEFIVRFTGATDSPFEWTEEKGASVTGTVKAGAARDGKETRYKYTVGVDGKERDPIIIIDK